MRRKDYPFLFTENCLNQKNSNSVMSGVIAKAVLVLRLQLINTIQDWLKGTYF